MECKEKTAVVCKNLTEYTNKLCQHIAEVLPSNLAVRTVTFRF